MSEKRTLVIGPSWVGDLVMANALFQVLHAKGQTLDVLVPPWNLATLSRMSEVNQGLSLPFKHGEFNLKGRFKMGKSLRDQYSHAYVLPNSWKSALLPYFAKIPHRVGFRGEMRYGLLNDVRILDKSKLSLMVDRYVALGYSPHEPFEHPLPKLTVKQTDIQAVLQKLDLKANPQQPILSLCPGAAYGESKRWPGEYYAKVAKAKLDAGWQVWLWGTKVDHQQMCGPIQQACDHRCQDFSQSGLGLDEVIDLMSLSAAVVSNDSGLMHVAAALGRPVVGIFGSTSAEHTPPLGPQSEAVFVELPCRPCFQRTCKFKHLHCLFHIQPERVLTAIDRLIEAR